MFIKKDEGPAKELVEYQIVWLKVESFRSRELHCCSKITALSLSEFFLTPKKNMEIDGSNTTGPNKLLLAFKMTNYL